LRVYGELPSESITPHPPSILKGCALCPPSAANPPLAPDFEGGQFRRKNSSLARRFTKSSSGSTSRICHAFCARIRAKSIASESDSYEWTYLDGNEKKQHHPVGVIPALALSHRVRCATLGFGMLPHWSSGPSLQQCRAKSMKNHLDACSFSMSFSGSQTSRFARGPAGSDC
jgi:hypothetical protein